jgi:thiol-disulfide isomerase/thioredoxin
VRRWLIPVIVLAALVAIDAAVRYGRSAPSRSRPSPWLTQPHPLRAFAATDLGGHDLSTATWGERVVVVNFWATWCLPCRREIPALSAIQDRHRDKLLVIGVLQDNVTPDAARAFAAGLRMSYPIVASTFEIEQSFPWIEVLPMTFVVDGRRQVVATYAGEIDPVRFEADLLTILKRP